MRISQGILGFAALALVTACSEPEVILDGERLAVRDALDGTSAQEARAAVVARSVPISLPPVSANADWTHRGGNAAHRLAHPALQAPQGVIFSTSIGQGNDRKHRIAADPVVAGGRIFTLDSRARVQATGTNGAVLWASDLTPGTDKADDASGGGLATADGRVFATTGFGELAALDAATGAVIWRQKFDAAVGGAPTVSGGMVFVLGRDATAWAVRASDGRVEWQLPGTPGQAGVTGASAPATDGGLVIFPFASGELLAVDPASGTRAWVAQVGGARAGRAYASVSDLTGDPVIDGRTVYAGSAAGRLVSINSETGLQNWSATEGAVNLVRPVGNAVFLISDAGNLVRLDAANGAVTWAVPLPYFTKDKLRRQKAIFAHFGPVLAGGRLYIASSDQRLRAFDPASGALLAELELPGGAASAPVVAGGVLYVVSAKGQLLAFR